LYSSFLLNAFFVISVTLIWFMLAYQSLLFFLGHRYYRQTRRSPGQTPRTADGDLPSVSILVPCHNEERVIAHTLRALLALDYPAAKMDFLIVNDGSTDRTADILRPFTADPRVKLLEVPAAVAARGKAGALNYGLRFATAPILAIYDADNSPEPGALRPLVDNLISDPALGAAVGMYRVVNRHRNVLTRFLNIEGITFQWIIQAGRWMLMRFVGLPGTNYVIRRDLIDRLGGWDENALTEDAELTIRVYRAGYFVKFVPTSTSWEQEPETLAVWFRQRNRWVRGYNYLFRKYAGSLLRARPHRIALELLYSLSLYYIFFAATIISDLLFLLSITGIIRITVPGPYALVWVFAFCTFVLQLIVALACERDEDTPLNILLSVAMYFSYCQMWIPVVARALYDDFIATRPMRWVKTERFEVE